MLKSSYEEVIYGKNYFSLIYALLLKKRNKSVLVIDHEDLFFGNNFTSNLSLLEVFYLKKMGEEFNILTLKDIDRFLTPYTLGLYLDDSYIELHSSALHHLNELSRKIPECFSSEFIKKFSELDQNYLNALISFHFKKVSEHYFKFPDDGLDLSIDNTELNSLFNYFVKVLMERKSDKIKELYLTLQIVFQAYFSYVSDEKEAKFLFFKLLSPQYKVDEEKLTDSLLFEFKTLGGDDKKTKIIDWDFYKNDLKSLLLASYEGLIGTGNLRIFSDIDHKFPFKINNSLKRFYSFRLGASISHKFMYHHLGRRIIFVSKDSFATDFPCVEIEFLSENYLEAEFIFMEADGLKNEFYFAEAKKIIFKNLLKVLPGISPEEWLYNTKLVHHGSMWGSNLNQDSNTFNPQNIRFFDLNSGEKLSSLTYMGLFKTKYFGSLGFLSSLKKSALSL